MEPTRRLSPIDAWWNREFPPYSTRRLLFLLGAFQVVGLVPFLGLRVAGVRVPLVMYAIGTVAGAAILALTWSSLRPPEQRAPARAEGFAFRSAETGSYQPSLHDLVVALPFAVASVLVTRWAVSSLEETLRPESILMGLIAGAALAAAIVLRYSLWGFVLISSVTGLGVGLLLYLVTMIWQGGGSFLLSWAIGTALAASFAHPMWSGMRARHARRVTEGIHREVPTLVLMSAVLVLSISGAVAFRFVS